MSTLIIDLNGMELTREEVELLEHPLVAGLILFSRNFYDRCQLQALIQSIRTSVNKPLLITVDQEGGRVQRFREGFTQLPAMQAFSRITNLAQRQAMALEAGWQMATEMVALDIDLSFAPVLDVGHICRAIGDRSFSDTVEDVIALAGQFIDGMQQAGMATTGKHFPGHGRVIEDSHLETPYDHRSESLIFTQDIKPFQHFIQRHKLDAVMPAHVIYPQCDKQPASGSSYWLKTVLRQQLQFQGTIFSDDLGMKGAGFMGDFVARSEQALTAGCDLLLLCNEREGVIQVLDRLKLSENQPHFLQRQSRLQRLFKRNSLTWNKLECNRRWLDNRKTLSALQQDWLACQ
ncbi:beta-N-acetylhexosaminidase [Rodentibacter caecimuris]|uniref:Beta-hexosaminidase n=1 Tax=Rodentibacter caecimuris TaxID=1796644 RepID=A0ABX3KZ60_9PAST|nr:beta-N-acetylhexosaminidase [Rodentibacter heylii]